MTLPGFTAEASLYETSGRYQQVAILATRTREQEVVPQLFRQFCSGDGCFCLWCTYDDYTGDLVYCDAVWLC